MILIDSAIYIDWLRQRTDPQLLLKPWILEGSCWQCGIIRVEVLRGVIHPVQKHRVAEFFEILPEVVLDTALWDTAAELAWSLDRKGMVLPATDVIIASCAIQVEALLISTDAHFKSIPNLRLQTTLPRR